MDGIRGVFFDLHGTLVISDQLSKAWDDWREAFHGCLAQRGLKSSLEEFSVEVDGIFEKPEPDYYAPGLSVFERKVMELCDRHSIEMDPVYMDWMVNHVIGIWYSYMFTDPEAEKVLDALKPRFRTALITNWDHASWLRRWLKDSEITGWFEDIVISDEVECVKPDPKIFSIALENLGLKPWEMVYVGDSPEDVQGALAAGSIPILIRRNLSEDQPDHRGIGEDVRVISSLTELLTIL
jgi:FMN phosphatase YigB (HAD superfamily)